MVFSILSRHYAFRDIVWTIVVNYGLCVIGLMEFA